MTKMIKGNQCSPTQIHYNPFLELLGQKSKKWFSCMIKLFSKNQKVYTNILFCLMLFVSLVAIAPRSSGSQTNEALNSFAKSFHFVLRDEDPSQIRDMVLMLKRNGFSKLYIALSKSTCLGYEYWDCSSATWSEKNLKEIIDFARSEGLEVSLEIKMINKVKKSFGHLSGALFNDETLDPDNPIFEALYEATFRYVSTTLGVREVVIGYDEIYGFSENDQKALQVSGQKMLGVDQFVKGLEIAQKSAENNHIQIAIWGDMLIDNRYLDDGGSRHNHGSELNGYGQIILPFIPNEIVIIAWYYEDTNTFGGIETLRKFGFNVRAATFKPNNTRRALVEYADQVGLPELIYTSFRFLRSKEIKDNLELCKFLQLGPCCE